MSDTGSHVATTLAGVLLRTTPGPPHTQVQLIVANKRIGKVQGGWQQDRPGRRPWRRFLSVRAGPGTAAGAGAGTDAGARRRWRRRATRRWSAAAPTCTGALLGGGGCLGRRRRQGRGRGLGWRRAGSRLAAAPTGAVAFVAGSGGDGDFGRYVAAAGVLAGGGDGGVDGARSPRRRDPGVGRRRLRGPQRRSAAGTGTGDVVGGGYGGGSLGQLRRRRTRGRRSAAAAAEALDGGAGIGGSGRRRQQWRRRRKASSAVAGAGEAGAVGGDNSAGGGAGPVRPSVTAGTEARTGAAVSGRGRSVSRRHRRRRRRRRGR